MNTFTATATNLRRSTHFGSEREAIERGAFDLDVTLTITVAPDAPVFPWTIVESGEVTLVLIDGEYHAYGGRADHWIDGRLLSAMRQLSAVDFRAACNALEAAAIAAASVRS